MDTVCLSIESKQGAHRWGYCYSSDGGDSYTCSNVGCEATLHQYCENNGC